MTSNTSTEWHTAANSYLSRLGRAEWEAQGCPVPTKRRRHHRFCPSQYMRDLIALMGANDEEGFKTRKMLEGYASALRV